MVTERVTRYFLLSEDGHTNEVFARYLNAITDFSEGTRLWEADYPFVRQAIKDSRSQYLNFEVFRQRGNGRIEIWVFDRKEMYAAARKIAHERLEEILERLNRSKAMHQPVS